jgi:hypothetical protein
VKGANQILGNERCKAPINYVNAFFVRCPHWPASQPFENSPLEKKIKIKINAVYLMRVGAAYKTRL